MKKTILMLVVLAFFTIPAFCLSSRDLYAEVDAQGYVGVNDASGVVCGDLGAAADLGIGAVVEYDYALFGYVHVADRLYTANLSRFVDAPSFLQFSAGIGGHVRFDRLILSAKIGFTMLESNDSWETGMELSFVPKYIMFEYGASDVMHYSIGFPVSVLYTGNTSRISVGVAVGMEVYK